MNVPEAPELEHTSCPLCGCDDSMPIVQAVDRLCGIPGVYTVCRCRACRHMFMNPRPTAKTLHRCYPDDYGPHQTPPPEAASAEAFVDVKVPWYLRYLPLRHIPGLKSFYYWLTDDLGQPLPSLVDSDDDLSGPTALELGSSTGAYLARLKNAGWQVTGIEPNTTASQKAREAGYNVHTGVLDDVALPERAFDCVAAWMVVEHTLDPVGTLREFFRLLKPNGQLLISIPNVGCWEPIIFGKSWYLWEAPRHLHHFAPASIRRVLQDSGYCEIRVLHQRNVLNVVGSLGIFLKRIPGMSSLGERVLRYPDSPRLWIQLWLSPLAHLLSLFRQGGRLTVLARRPRDDDKPSSETG